MPDGHRPEGEPADPGRAGHRRATGRQPRAVCAPSDAVARCLRRGGRGEPTSGILDGARVLVVAGDIFVAADLDLLIDDANGVTAALAISDKEALMLLSR